MKYSASMPRSKFVEHFNLKYDVELLIIQLIIKSCFIPWLIVCDVVMCNEFMKSRR